MPQCSMYVRTYIHNIGSLSYNEEGGVVGGILVVGWIRHVYYAGCYIPTYIHNIISNVYLDL